MRGCLSIFSCCFPWGICTDVFKFLKKKRHFWIFFTNIYFVFVNMGPNGSKNIKTLLLLQIVTENFQTFPEFSSQWSSQKCLWYIWNFENSNFSEFISFSFNMGPYESENFKTIFLLQITGKGFKICPKFSSHCSSQNYCVDVWNFEFPICGDFFFCWNCQIQHCTQWGTKRLN